MHVHPSVLGSVCGPKVPIRRRGKVNSKEQHRKRRPEPGTHASPSPEQGDTDAGLGSPIIVYGCSHHA